MFKNLILCIVLVSVGMSSARATFKDNRFQLTTVDKVDVRSDGVIRLAFTLPCKDLNSLGFTTASDDSGDLELSVGVVFNCTKGARKKFEKIIVPGSSEYGALAAGVEEGASIIPMKVRRY